MGRKAASFLECLLISLFVTDTRNMAQVCAIHNGYSKGGNGRLWVRIGQGCVGKQKADSNVTLTFPPSLPFLRNHFSWYTNFHQRPGSFCSRIFKNILKWEKAMLEEFTISFHRVKLLISCPRFYSRYLLPNLYKKTRINLMYNSLVKKVEYKHRGRKKARGFASLWHYKLTSLSAHCSFIFELSSRCATNISEVKFYPRIMFAFC